MAGATHAGMPLPVGRRGEHEAGGGCCCCHPPAPRLAWIPSSPPPPTARRDETRRDESVGPAAAQLARGAGAHAVARAPIPLICCALVATIIEIRAHHARMIPSFILLVASLTMMAGIIRFTRPIYFLCSQNIT